MQVLILLVVILGSIIIVALALFSAFIVTRSKTHEQIRPNDHPGLSLMWGNFANGSERRVHNTLFSLYPENESCHLMSGIVLLDNRGEPYQIDHILIKENGLFVIETKNWNGVVRGQERVNEWTLIRSNGESKTLHNPLM